MSHDHNTTNYTKAFIAGIALNLGFVLIEAFYGWHADSLALLADAGHNLSDVGTLLLGWAAYGAARLLPNKRHTYGWRRGSILASFTSAILLLVAMGSLAWEAVQRLNAPATIDATTVMIVAGAGVFINAFTASMFIAGSKHDLNIRGVFLHMAADSLLSAGVVVSGGLYLWLGWTFTDPIVSLLIAMIIVVSTSPLVRQSLHLLFDGVPDSIKLDEVHQSLLALPGVRSVHDLHVWAMGTRETALTAHLVIDDDHPDHALLLTKASEILHDRFEIRHTTLQQESSDYATQCPALQGHCWAGADLKSIT